MRVLALLAFLALFASIGAVSSAQPYSGDYFVSTFDYNPTPHCCAGAGLYRMTRTGQLTTLTSFFSRHGGGWVCFPWQLNASGRRLVSAGWNTIFEWDATTNAQLRTTQAPGWTTGLSAHHASGFVVASNGMLMHLAPDLVTWSTIAPLKPGNPVLPAVSIHGQDLWSGDYIVVDDGMGTMSLLSTDGRRARSLGVSKPGITSAGIVQSHLDGDFRIFTSRGLLRLDPRTLTQSTLTTVALNYAAAAFDRALGRGAISLLVHGTLRRLDPSGRAISTSSILSYSGHPSLIGHADEREFAAIRQSSPNLWWLQLSRPADAGRPYVIAISMTGFTPGIPLGGRTIPLALDALFSLSVQGRLAPSLTGNLGTLSTNGFGIGILDLRRFGNSLAGLRLWAAAAVFHPAAPSGLSLITKPVVLVLD